MGLRQDTARKGNKKTAATVPSAGDDSWLLIHLSSLPSTSCYQGLRSGAEVTVSLLSPSQIFEMINS